MSAKPPPMEKQQPEMWQFIPALQSGTMRWLLVAGASWLATTCGVPEALVPERAEQLVELVLQILQGFALMWAAYHRYANPTPPLAMTKGDANQRNAARAAGGE